MDLAKTFEGIAQKMQIDFEEARNALGDHPGMKGDASEKSLRKFLRPYFPLKLDMSTGKVIDSTGYLSKQLDIIISDSSKIPVFYDLGDVRVIPIEGVYAVIEVKSSLETGDLDSILENMLSVRGRLKRAHYGDLPSKNLYGKEWAIWPVHYFVFAYSSSTKLETLAKGIHERHQQRSLPVESRIDSVCVLDRGVILNHSLNNKIDALPSPDSWLNFVETNQALLLFYLLISRYLNQAEMPNFRISDYLEGTEFGNMELPGWAWELIFTKLDTDRQTEEQGPI